MAETARPIDGGSLRLLHGILFMCLAVTLFSVLNASGKYLSAEYSTLQIVWARFAFALAFMLVAFAPSGSPVRLFRTRRPRLQIMRSLFQVAGTACYFKGLSYVPLSTAVAISFVTPLVITMLSIPVLGERVGLRRWSAVAVGFVGALIIVRPGMGDTHWAVLFLLANCLLTGTYQLLTRKVSRDDPPETSATYTTLLGTVIVSALVPFDWRTPDGLVDALLFPTMGVFAGAGHLLLAMAYQRGPAAVISPFNYGQLLGATVLGYLIWEQLPDGWTWFGSGILIACGLYIAHREAVRRR